jgi:hypothetical protein
VTISAAERRLAAIVQELGRLHLDVLVMGGHAVRYYGVDRSTIDFDMVVALPLEEWNVLSSTLLESPFFKDLREGGSWRPLSFKRFVIGTLADGREERLEFWRENHLLAPFADLRARMELGEYGGVKLPFLGIDDLIRSKETERDDDWRDVRLLEEIADERRLAREAPLEALAKLRSQRGFAVALQKGLLADSELTAIAAAHAVHVVTAAFLAPYAALPGDRSVALVTPEIANLLDGPLRKVEGGSARHLALVEAVRRLYQRQRMTEDRADKEAVTPPARSRR